MTEPPQHLLGGLQVAVLVAPGSSLDQIETTRYALEELGVSVLLVGPGRGPVSCVRSDGSQLPTPVSQSLTVAAPDAFDAALVIAQGRGAEYLAASDEAMNFLARIDAEHKPIGAIGSGLLPVLAAGLARSRSVSAATDLAAQAREAGASPSAGPVTVDGTMVSLSDEQGLESFHASLKELLARRRLSSITLDNDTPSAVGEDG